MDLVIRGIAKGFGNQLQFLRSFEQKVKDVDIFEVTDTSRPRTYRILKIGSVLKHT